MRGRRLETRAVAVPLLRGGEFRLEFAFSRVAFGVSRGDARAHLIHRLRRATKVRFRHRESRVSLGNLRLERRNFRAKVVRRRRRRGVRREAFRREALRREAFRREAFRREAFRREAFRREALRREALRREAFRREALRREALRPRLFLFDAASEGCDFVVGGSGSLSGDLGGFRDGAFVSPSQFFVSRRRASRHRLHRRRRDSNVFVRRVDAPVAFRHVRFEHLHRRAKSRRLRLDRLARLLRRDERRANVRRRPPSRGARRRRSRRTRGRRSRGGRGALASRRHLRRRAFRRARRDVGEFEFHLERLHLSS